MARVKPGHCTMACCMALPIIAFSDTEKAPLAASLFRSLSTSILRSQACSADLKKKMTNLYVVANSRLLLDVKFLLHRRGSSSFKMMGTIHRKTRRWAYSNSNTLALNARKRDKISQRLESFPPRPLLCKEERTKRARERDLCRRGRPWLETINYEKVFF